MNLICGINPVLEALNAGTRHFDRLLVVKGLRNPRVSEAIARASGRGIPLRFEAREMLDRLSGGLAHQGVIAVVSAKPVLDIEALVDQARQPAFLVVLDGVEDPRNLGAILRSVEAAGGDGVVLPERHSSALSETVARASAGALEHVRVARVGNLAQSLERLKERGLWVVGFDAAAHTRWDAVDLKRPVALVLGGEGRGIRRLVRERCDELVSIPMLGHLGSLNVSVAAGIAAFEVVRQRGLVPSAVKPIPPRAVPPTPQVLGPDMEDGESDPGALAPPVADAAREEEEQPEEELFESSIRFHHEELAWRGSGAASEATAARRPENDRRRRGRGSRADRPEAARGARRGEAGPAQAERRGPGQPREGDVDDSRRRRGRRRRRRGGPGPTAAAGGGGGPEPMGPQAPPSQAGRPGEPGLGRRRRRRRGHRRH